ncbi:MAG: CoA transferase [Actinomycetota bacterium]|nr:CoA transferase [Actinomycetota bacterium]MDQ6946629.1 CoA transferase [Actinomycetota bacterium]
MADNHHPAPTGPALAEQVCRGRLQPVIGTTVDSLPVSWDISWHGPATDRLGPRGSESTIQARSGLMEVHGWDAGRPRRLGLDVASVAAGLVAGNGLLAALIGARRDRPVARIETSALQAGLLLVSHHIAAATSGGELLPSPPGPQPGPPFRTADGRWCEIEVFEAETWKAFWCRLGAGDADLGRAWTAFRSRYYRGRCSFPPGLHEATARLSLSELTAVAESCQVSLAPLRTYPEVLAHPGWTRRAVAAIGGAPAAPAATASPKDRRGELPLAGLRLVEATNRMQGPLAGLLLQMLGAEVVRVEPPGGDIGRMVPPACGEVGSFFLCFNRGKRSVELDLTRPAGRRELLELLSESDAFLHNWRPGKASEWGLDAPGATEANPRLVYAEATGWGESSENAHLIGTDFLVQAYAGFGDGLNPVGEAPRTSRALLTDCLGALVTCEGILAGLYLRETTGQAVPVVTSLLEGAMAAQAHILDALGAGRPDGRQAGRPVWGPLDRPIEADGGSVVVSVEDDSDYARLCDICGIDTSGDVRVADEEALVACIAQDPPDHWEKLLRPAGIPCAAASRDLATLPADPNLSPLLETLGESCQAPASPWTLGW